MLTYNKNLMGKITLEDGHEIQIRQGNCLAVMIYEYEKDGETWHQLFNFYADEQHLKNIKKNEGSLMIEDYKEIRLNMFYKECKTLLKWFTKEGKEVICYYDANAIDNE